MSAMIGYHYSESSAVRATNPVHDAGSSITPRGAARSTDVRLTTNVGDLEPSSFRLAMVNAIRARIADGTYETPECINGTVDRLLDVLA